MKHHCSMSALEWIDKYLLNYSESRASRCFFRKCGIVKDLKTFAAGIRCHSVSGAAVDAQSWKWIPKNQMVLRAPSSFGLALFPGFTQQCYGTSPPYVRNPTRPGKQQGHSWFVAFMSTLCVLMRPLKCYPKKHAERWLVLKWSRVSFNRASFCKRCTDFIHLKRLSNYWWSLKHFYKYSSTKRKTGETTKWEF